MRSMTEGEDSSTYVRASSPSVAFGATSPLRGRIEMIESGKHNGNACLSARCNIALAPAGNNRRPH